MLYHILQRVAKPFLFGYCRLKVTGLKNLPQKTNFIIVSNHVSFLDPLVIMDVIPYKICYIAMRDIYKFGWLRWLLHLTRTLPSGSASIKAINLLENNRNVGIFPEGGISRDGRLKEFRRGAALLALKTGRPIVPCAILGTFEALPYGKRFPKPVPLELKIGKPIFLLKELSDIIDDVQLREGTFRIRQAVKELLNA